MGTYVYILRCSDGSYYVGSTRGSLDDRVGQHQAGNYDGYTARRRPVQLLFDQEFERITEAIAAKRQLKNGSRAKKEALIRGDFEALRALAKNKTQFGNATQRPSTGSG
jgi:putative endonuclease